MIEVDDSIKSLVADCCVELFSSYGVALAPTSHSRANLTFCATIGFTGPHLRGSLLIAASREPLALAGEEPDESRDWIAELANQMLGRIKNRLIMMGTVIYYSTPVFLRGEHLARLGDQPPPLLFEGNGGVVSVWFDLDVGSDLVIPVAGATASHAASEGDVLLF